MYLSQGELIQSFSKAVLIQLSNDDYTAREVDESLLKKAIEVAEERIDASLRGRYHLPLAQTPTLIRFHALSLARYWLYQRRPEGKIPESVKDDYKQALKELEQIALGRLHLGLAEDNPSPKTGDLLPDVGEYQVKSGSRVNTEGY